MIEEEHRKSIESELAWCREQRERSKAILQDFKKGRRDYRGVGGDRMVDVTDKIKAQYGEIVVRMDELISAYERLLDA